MENKAPTTKTEDYASKVERLEQQVADLTNRLQWYEQQFRLSQQKRFGASSEQTHPDQLALDMFNEAEALSDPTVSEPTVESITYKRKKQVGGREAKLGALPVERIEYRLSEEERSCPCCAEQLREMSTEVRRELAVIPEVVKAVEHVRYVYVCDRCEKEEITTPIRTASMPTPMAPGSLASPSIVAYIMSQKYADSLPLYRQEAHFLRMGIELSRQTMANWLMSASESWLTPLYRYLHADLLRRDILHADETSLQVLKEPGRAAQTKSYLWLYRTGRDEPAVVLYDYRQGRGSEHPERFLAGFSGYLQSDGYSGYRKLEGVTQLGCWAHARRYYNDALQIVPLAQRSQTAAAEGLAFCNALFEVERKWKSATPEERYQARLTESQPILGQFHAWLQKQSARALPKGLLGKAVTYSLNQWEKLTAFLKDGRLEIDNNRSERSIKPVVIGRKNFLFSNTPRGARASAVIYSIVETAKANGLKPMAYLQHLFEQLPQLPDVSDPGALSELAPWSSSLPSACRQKS